MSTNNPLQYYKYNKELRFTPYFTFLQNKQECACDTSHVSKHFIWQTADVHYHPISLQDSGKRKLEGL